MPKLLDDIKKDANRNGTKIQSSLGTQIEHTLNKLFYLDKNIPKETEFVRMVMTRGLESSERVGLHASAIIVGETKFCYRQQVLSLFYKMKQGEQVPIGLKKIFEEGDSIHQKWQRLFIRGGYANPEDCDRTQFADIYDLSFTPDIIATLPIDWVESGKYEPTEVVVEIKSVNTMQFRKMSQHPSGRKQLQLYMYLTGIHKGFVLCEDKNTQEIKVFPYKYNPSEIQEVITRLENIQQYKAKVIEKGKMVKRCDNCTGAVCKRAVECPMIDACYNVGNGRRKINLKK